LFFVDNVQCHVLLTIQTFEAICCRTFSGLAEEIRICHIIWPARIAIDFSLHPASDANELCNGPRFFTASDPDLGRSEEDGDKEEEVIGDARRIAKVFVACY
jgi:hypothetical protein